MANPLPRLGQALPSHVNTGRRRPTPLAFGIATALAALTAAGCGSSDSDSSVSGTISAESLDAVEFAEGTVIEVTLADISLADAAATTVATDTFEADGLPADYSLSWSDELDERSTYSVGVRVEFEDELLFINDTAFLYEPGEERLDITVIRVDS